MTGLGAIIYRDGREASSREIEKIARALQPHGPDQISIRRLGPVAFAITQSNVTASPQPVVGAGGHIVLIFDGWLANRDDLARSLGLSSTELSRLTDPALAMRSWQRWGEQSLLKWVGEFALLVWDAQAGKLFAARDPFGGRLLHYHVTKERVAFASAPKGLHALPDIPRAIDERKIAQSLCQIYTDSGRSFFKDIARLPPACVLQVVAGREPVTSTYYRLKDNIRLIRYRHDQDYVQEARALFEAAVSSTMDNSRKTGVFLSGGLDSSAVAAEAARHYPTHRHPLRAFTAVPEKGWDGRVPPGWYGDETPFVQTLEKSVPNLSVRYVDAQGYDHTYRQDQFLFAAEAPQRNALGLAWVHDILEQAKGDGISLMLSGFYGDLTLSYDGEGIFPYLWRSGQYRQLLRELNLISRTPAQVARRFFSTVVLPQGPDWLWKAKEKLRGRRGLGSRIHWPRASAIHPMFAEDMAIADEIDPGPGGIWDGEKPLADPRALMLDTFSEIAGETAEFNQGFSTLYGIELRDPFADRRLVEWSRGVPEDQFYKAGQPRWLMRRVMRGRVPDAILDKPKDQFRGAQVADWHLKLSRARPAILSSLEGFAEDTDVARMIDLDRLKHLLQDWPDSTVTNPEDDRSFYLPVVLPMALQIAEFVRRVNGGNR